MNFKKLALVALCLCVAGASVNARETGADWQNKKTEKVAAVKKDAEKISPQSLLDEGKSKGGEKVLTFKEISDKVDQAIKTVNKTEFRKSFGQMNNRVKSAEKKMKKAKKEAEKAKMKAEKEAEKAKMKAEKEAKKKAEKAAKK